MKKFWKWKNEIETENEDEGVERILELNGTIASETWFNDDITPKMFKDELYKGSGKVTVWINSPGGDSLAASQIYTMLKDYKNSVTVKIDGLAASAASVIAMAGDKIIMSPTSLMMIHNPSTIAQGDHNDMKKAIDILDEVKESIINAYEAKTHKSRSYLSKLMEEETWMNAKKALELGFADEILGSDDNITDSYMFKVKEFDNVFLNKLCEKAKVRKISDLKSDLEKIKKYL